MPRATRKTSLSLNEIPKERTTSAMEVTEQIRDGILEGQLLPGQRLQQEHLSAWLNVSTTPIREALALLEREGAVIYEPHRGYSVRSFSLDESLAAWDTRTAIEVFGVGLCAKQGLDDIASTNIAEILASAEQIISHGELDDSRHKAFRASNAAFHREFITASRNPWVGSFLKQLEVVPLASSRIIFLWQDFENLKLLHDEHSRIFEAVLDRDGKRAEAIMFEHLRRATKMLKDSQETPSSDPISAVAGNRSQSKKSKFIKE